MIDDVNFSETPDNELVLSNQTFGGWWLGYQVTGDLGCDYTLYPMSQASAMPYRIEGVVRNTGIQTQNNITCLLYTSPSPRDPIGSRMPSSA